MQPETMLLWMLVFSVGASVLVLCVVDIYSHWNKCRHDWTKWHDPEKPEPNHWMPQSYAYQTRYCKKCNQFERREVK